VVRTTVADANRTKHDNYIWRVYSAEMLLMMDSGPVRNTYSTLSNKFEKLCIMLAFIIRMHIQCWRESNKEKRLLYKTAQSVHGKIIRKMYPKETISMDWIDLA
jgi:hypothetical protein